MLKPVHKDIALLGLLAVAAGGSLAMGGACFTNNNVNTCTRVDPGAGYCVDAISSNMCIQATSSPTGVTTLDAAKDATCTWQRGTIDPNSKKCVSTIPRINSTVQCQAASGTHCP